MSCVYWGIFHATQTITTISLVLCTNDERTRKKQKEKTKPTNHIEGEKTTPKNTFLETYIEGMEIKQQQQQQQNLPS